jgi:RNA recognition motif-containing protein
MANIDAAKAKNTVFIGGLAPNVDENILVEAFSPFGLLGSLDVMEV